MNEQLHTDCSILRNKMPAVLPIDLSVILSQKVRGPDIFKQIVRKYTVVTKSGRLPALILFRLLENAGGMAKLTNVNRNITQKILNTSIRQGLNLRLPSQSGQNVTVSEPDINNALPLAKDTKQIVIPRLMRYLQRIDDQDTGSDIQPVSSKALPTTELVRKLPERMVSQREKSENTEEQRTGRKNSVIHSKRYDPETDIRVIKHTMQPTLATILQDRTQADKVRASGTQIERTVQFSELHHLKDTNISHFDEYNDPVDIDISGADVSKDTKAIDVISHPLTHADENNPKIDPTMVHIQKRNKHVYEKHEDFSRRTSDRYSVTEKNNIANRLISNTHIARSKVKNMGAEAGEIKEIPKGISTQEDPQKNPKLLFDQDGVFLQHAENVRTGMIAPSNLSSNNIVKKPSDLVLRKPVVHSAEKGSENTEKSDIVKTERTKINAEKEDIIGANIPPGDSIDDIANTANIATIADRVYKLLETRISIEKERRGLR